MSRRPFLQGLVGWPVPLCGGVFPQHPHTAVGVAAEEVISIEFDDARCDHVKEILDFYIFLWRRLRTSFSCHRHFFLSDFDFDFEYRKSRHISDGLK